MRAWLAGYSLGIFVVSQIPALDRSLAVAALAIFICVFLLGVARSSRLFWLCSTGVCIGFLWHWCWGVQHLQQQLPEELEGQDITVQGRVVGLPVSTATGQRFIFQVEQGDAAVAGRRLALNHYSNTDSNTDTDTDTANTTTNSLLVRPGEHWQLLVRLKRAHGFSNPGSYDSEANLIRQGVVATGYVRSVSSSLKLAQESWGIGVVRYRILTLLRQLLNDNGIEEAQQGLMLALILGDRSMLTSEHWALFSATGTNHLFVISGLHIGLITLLCFKICKLLMRLNLGRGISTPTPSLAAVLAIGVAIAYSLLAGWTLPTQRACLMVIAMLLTYLLGRRFCLSLRLLMAMALVLSFDPLATTSSGFWLSFMAVSVLLFFTRLDGPDTTSPITRSPGRRVWQRFMQPQWAVFVGLLLPLSIWMGQVSLIAPIVNVIAIPVLGMLIVPLLLCGSLLLPLASDVAAVFFLAASYLLQILLEFLVTVRQVFHDFALLPVDPIDSLELLLLVPGLLLLLLPNGMPFRWLVLPLSLPLLIAEENTIATGELQVHVLDVGQGLAVLLATENHTLLFDAGPGSYGEWDAGSAIVIPALQRLGLPALQRMVISHSDADHAGGLAALQHRFPETEILGGEPVAGFDMQPCRAGDSWQWDGVRFRILHPVVTASGSNNNSCVLHISVGRQSLLLPGDIDATVERQLVLEWRDALASTVLVAAHHGSKTSSSYAFLKTVAADHVIFASGYRNSFQHPAAPIVVRHSQMGTELYNTASTGMLSFRLSDTAQPVIFKQFRQSSRRYWAWSDNRPSCRYC